MTEAEPQRQARSRLLWSQRLRRIRETLKHGPESVQASSKRLGSRRLAFVASTSTLVKRMPSREALTPGLTTCPAESKTNPQRFLQQPTTSSERQSDTLLDPDTMPPMRSFSSSPGNVHQAKLVERLLGRPPPEGGGTKPEKRCVLSARLHVCSAGAGPRLSRQPTKAACKSGARVAGGCKGLHSCRQALHRCPSAVVNHISKKIGPPGNNTLTIRTFLFSLPLSARAHACTASFCVLFFYRPTGRPRRTSLPLECHRNATNRTRFVSSARHSTSR
jgi:hypothetical protein